MISRGEPDPRTLLDQARFLLLDFDGPVCDVFAGLSSGRVVTRMLKRLPGLELEDLTHSHDPFEVWRAVAARGGRDEAVLAERLLRDAEVDAVAVARPTDHADDVLLWWRRTGRRAGIVSNNSAEAVHGYLHRHRLNPLVDVVAARDAPDLGLLKPNPALLRRAVGQLREEAGRGVLVGDSVADVLAAKALGMPVIGYATAAGKAEMLRAAGAVVVVTTLRRLLRSPGIGESHPAN